MERRRVILDNIYIGSRHREPNDGKVREIAKSIADVGLMNPPAIVFRDGIVVDGEELENVPVLIYGRHRVLALQSLGETSFECDVYDVSDKRAELMEIDENLARSELSPAQEEFHLLRREVLWGEIFAEENSGEEIFPTRSSGKLKTLGPQHQKKFAAEVAEITGLDKSGINKKLARARVLGDELLRIEGTSLDKGVEMKALAAMPEPERVLLIDRAAAGEVVSARPAPAPKPKPTPNADEAVDVIAAMEIIAGGIVEAQSAPLAIIDRLDAAKSAAFAAMDSALGQFSTWPKEWKEEFLAARDVAAILKV